MDGKNTGCPGATGAVAGPGRRVSARRKLAAVQQFLRGESREAVSRELNVPVHRLVEWRDRALMAAEGAAPSSASATRAMTRSCACGPGWARSPWPTSFSARRSTGWRAAAPWPGGASRPVAERSFDPVDRMKVEKAPKGEEEWPERHVG